MSRCLAEIYKQKLCLLEVALKTMKLAEVARNGNSTAVHVLLEENVDPNPLSADTVDTIKSIFGQRDDTLAISIYLLCFERG